MTLTATVVAALDSAFQSRYRECPRRNTAWYHSEKVFELAEWAGEWLARAYPFVAPPGFTCHASFGGGDGWDTEAGVTFVFANLGAGQLAQVQDFALALKSREGQQAVVFLVREEQFSLV